MSETVNMNQLEKPKVDFTKVDPTLYILNEENVKMKKSFIIKLMKKYDVKVDAKEFSLKLFQRAMIHPSYLKRDLTNDQSKKIIRETEKDMELEPISNPNKAIPLQTESYERLEFLGDAVIHLAIADYLFHRYKDQDEGFMTRLRTKIENKDSLAKLSKIVGLEKYVVISRRRELRESRSKNPSILEDSLEAFVGACYENFGFNKSRNFVVNLIEKEIDIAEILRKETNYKDTLLQYHHKMKWDDPKYDVYKKIGPDHARVFIMYVTDKENKPFKYGKGLSKKKGEQDAAKKALIEYGLLDEDDEEETESKIIYDNISEEDTDLEESDIEEDENEDLLSFEYQYSEEDEEESND